MVGTRPPGPGPPVSQWTPKLPAATEPQAASHGGAARRQAPAGGKLERRTAPSSRARCHWHVPAPALISGRGTLIPPAGHWHLSTSTACLTSGPRAAARSSRGAVPTEGARRGASSNYSGPLAVGLRFGPSRATSPIRSLGRQTPEGHGATSSAAHAGSGSNFGCPL